MLKLFLYDAVSFAYGLHSHSPQIRAPPSIFDQVIEPDFWFPSEHFPGFRSVRNEAFDLGWPEIFWVYTDMLAPIQAGIGECLFHEFTHRVGFAGADDEIVRFIVLQDLPHALYVFGRETPISPCIQVPHIKIAFFLGQYPRYAAGYFSRDKSLAPSRRCRN